MLIMLRATAVEDMVTVFEQLANVLGLFLGILTNGDGEHAMIL